MPHLTLQLHMDPSNQVLERGLQCQASLFELTLCRSSDLLHRSIKKL